jgi:hypothetical protein
VERRRVISLDRHDELALVVDARVGLLPATRAPGRLFAVFAEPGDPDGFALESIAIGDPRLIVEHPTVPPCVAALAHSAVGWSAPLPDDGVPFVRPSLHPLRRRAHTTTLVAGRGEVWSVVRIGDDPPQVWPDGVGLIPDALRAAWVRHRAIEAHPSSRRVSAAPTPTRRGVPRRGQ